ncbi:MAG: hypothetical protein U0235_32995 [Polyangiaceae bacterium]
MRSAPHNCAAWPRLDAKDVLAPAELRELRGLADKLGGSRYLQSFGDRGSFSKVTRHGGRVQKVPRAEQELADGTRGTLSREERAAQYDAQKAVVDYLRAKDPVLAKAITEANITSPGVMDAPYIEGSTAASLKGNAAEVNAARNAAARDRQDLTRRVSDLLQAPDAPRTPGFQIRIDATQGNFLLDPKTGRLVEQGWIDPITAKRVPGEALPPPGFQRTPSFEPRMNDATVADLASTGRVGAQDIQILRTIPEGRPVTVWVNDGGTSPVRTVTPEQALSLARDPRVERIEVLQTDALPGEVNWPYAARNAGRIADAEPTQVRDWVVSTRDGDFHLRGNRDRLQHALGDPAVTDVKPGDPSTVYDLPSFRAVGDAPIASPSAVARSSSARSAEGTASVETTASLTRPLDGPNVEPYVNGNPRATPDETAIGAHLDGLAQRGALPGVGRVEGAAEAPPRKDQRVGKDRRGDYAFVTNGERLRADLYQPESGNVRSIETAVMKKGGQAEVVIVDVGRGASGGVPDEAYAAMARAVIATPGGVRRVIVLRGGRVIADTGASATCVTCSTGAKSAAEVADAASAKLSPTTPEAPPVLRPSGIVMRRLGGGAQSWVREVRAPDAPVKVVKRPRFHPFSRETDARLRERMGQSIAEAEGAPRELTREEVAEVDRVRSVSPEENVRLSSFVVDRVNELRSSEQLRQIVLEVRLIRDADGRPRSGLTEQPMAKGWEYEDLTSVARARAERAIADAVSEARWILRGGTPIDADRSLRDGFVYRVDDNRQNFRFAPDGSIREWFDPINVVPERFVFWPRRRDAAPAPTGTDDVDIPIE